MANSARGTEGEIAGLQLEGKELAAAIMTSAVTGDDATKRILIRQWLTQTKAMLLARAQASDIAASSNTHTQVLDEIGVDVASQLSAAPKGKVGGKETVDVSSFGIDDLEKRMAAHRNP